MCIQSHTPSKSTVNIANMGVGRGAGGVCLLWILKFDIFLLIF